jgi:hypothetical protein
LSNRFIERLLVASGNGDLRAFRDEKTGCGKSDATVPAGNKSLFACELHNASFICMTGINYDVRHTCDMMTIIDGDAEKTLCAIPPKRPPQNMSGL